MLPHRKHYNHQTKYFPKRRLTYDKFVPLPGRIFQLILDLNRPSVGKDIETWKSSLTMQPPPLTGNQEVPTSELLEDKRCAMLLPSVDIGKGPSLILWLGLKLSVAWITSTTPEKVISSQAWKCLLLRNGSTEILKFREKRQRLIWKVLFLLPHGPQNSRAEGWMGSSHPVRRGITKRQILAPLLTCSVTLDKLL